MTVADNPREEAAPALAELVAVASGAGVPRRQSLPVFDAHNAPSEALIDQCVHCGFCLATCPTYRLWSQEPDSPRGRIYLMKLGLQGEVELDRSLVNHFDRCLGCMACVTSCPSGVQYGPLIEATRAQIERRFRRTLGERMLRGLIFAMFPHPGRLRVLAVPLWVYQKTGLRRLVRKSGVMKLLPKQLQAMDDVLPPVHLFGGGGAHRQPATPRLRVGMLKGCVQRVFFDHVNRATARVLAAEGCEVVVPRGQGCCGALMTHSGEEAAALVYARRTIEAFEKVNVDVIVINAAGCGSAMKEYGHLLRDDPAYAARAAAFAAKCRDVSEILTTLPAQAPRQAVPFRIAYHDACHLQHAQGITAQPRRLLAGIPGLELCEIADPAICCGSAGIYNLVQPEAARQLGAMEAQNILRTKAQAVVSGNPGCTLQIQASLEVAGGAMPVLHWIELLDASVSGTIPASLRSLSVDRP